MSEIKYLTHTEIDKTKWDLALDKCYNGLIYAYSWYLDTMTNGKWDALIYKDYEAIFPLPYGIKYGLKFIYQPYFCQQLGLFSKHKITDEFFSKFIEKVPSKFKYWHFHLNFENKWLSPKLNFKIRLTYEIDLNKPYHEIYDSFKSDAKKNIAKLALIHYQVKKDISLDVIANLYFENYGKNYSNQIELKNSSIVLLNKAREFDKGFSIGIYNQNNELLSAGFFMISHHRIYYIMGAPTVLGKSVGATHALIDEVLKTYSETNHVFDFEGSVIDSVAYFYSKFGSKPHYFNEIINNKLPWWVKWLKT